MNVFEYAPLARRTLKMLPFREHMLHMALGITGEFGEIIDAVKKAFIYGKPVNPDDPKGERIFGVKALDHVNMIEEIGDTLWYVVNLLPELDVPEQYMQNSLDRGYFQGLKTQHQLNLDENLTLCEGLLALNQSVATQAGSLGRLNPGEVPGSAYGVEVIEKFAGNIGVLAGLLDVDLAMAMQRNIAKLAKRHGDKYNDVGVLVRDLLGERAVLEGKEHPVNLDSYKPLVSDACQVNEGPCEGCQ